MAKDYTYEPERGPSTALARRSVDDGEIVTINSDPIAIRDRTFEHAGAKPLPKAIAQKLTKSIDPRTEADILPTGEVYFSHVFVRRRLNAAVGPMGWAMRPVTDLMERPGELAREYALIVLGRVVATAFGAAKYYPTDRQGKPNPRADKADAAEMVKSNALTRCSKDLGIASECWDRRWCDKWRDDYAVHVLVKEKRGDKVEEKAYWRRIDAKPFRSELKPVKDSPNQDKWRKQWQGWTAMLEKEIKASEAVFEHRQSLLKQARAQGVKPAGGDTDAPDADRAADRDADQSEPRSTNDRSAPPTVHGRNLTTEEKHHKIQTCKVIDKTPQYVLHAITMADGYQVFTFSSSIYRDCQMRMAEGTLVEFDTEVQEARGRQYRHIVEMRLWKGGAK